ncbi:MAG: 4a-hydroxytetrahydrobiopterin dehydratase [Rhodoferax sp.]|nr:4a-hydroxytetrahydrobiopterin dehydratase [Rhodoferax sp.]
MNSMMKKTDWSGVSRRAMTATEIVAGLAKLEGWQLSGEGATLAIEKCCVFSNYYQTMAFVNAVAFIAHVSDHHPDLTVSFNRCMVRYNTHDVGGISSSDFDCASAVDALLQ